MQAKLNRNKSEIIFLPGYKFQLKCGISGHFVKHNAYKMCSHQTPYNLCTGHLKGTLHLLGTLRTTVFTMKLLRAGPHFSDTVP